MSRSSTDSPLRTTSPPTNHLRISQSHIDDTDSNELSESEIEEDDFSELEASEISDASGEELEDTHQDYGGRHHAEDGQHDRSGDSLTYLLLYADEETEEDAEDTVYLPESGHEPSEDEIDGYARDNPDDDEEDYDGELENTTKNGEQHTSQANIGTNSEEDKGSNEEEDAATVVSGSSATEGEDSLYIPPETSMSSAITTALSSSGEASSSSGELSIHTSMAVGSNKRRRLNEDVVRVYEMWHEKAEKKRKMRS